jgi:hypothetical protein
MSPHDPRFSNLIPHTSTEPLFVTRNKLKMKPKIKFAPSTTIDIYLVEVEELLVAIAKYMVEDGEDYAEWARHVFVSDESCIGDFLSQETEVVSLSDDLGLHQLRAIDRVCDVAAILHQRKAPN